MSLDVNPARTLCPEPFAVDVRPDRRRVIVAPRGELDLATAGDLEAELDALVEAGFHELVLDLRALSFIDSSGLSLIVGQAGRPDVTLRIIDGPPAVARLFELTGVYDRLRFLDATEVARVGPSRA
jgi:anti-anti-sigma factor